MWLLNSVCTEIQGDCTREAAVEKEDYINGRAWLWGWLSREIVLLSSTDTKLIKMEIMHTVK